MFDIQLKNPNELRFQIALNGFSLRSFSKEIGISHSFLSQIINQKKKPSATTAKKISNGLEKNIEYFFLIHMVDSERLEGN